MTSQNDSLVQARTLEPKTRSLVERTYPGHEISRSRRNITKVVLHISCFLVVCLLASHFNPYYAPGISLSHHQHHARYASPQEPEPEPEPSTVSSVISSETSSLETTATSSSPSASSTAVLEVFQVSVPIAQPQAPPADADDSVTGAADCSVTLMEYTFASSFGKPFVGSYTPPSCIDTANTVIMNFTATSKGVQFDRLALMYLGDTEVFRTSTAEPTRNGIRWVYEKDMSQYLSIWKAPQVMIFDLANIVDSNYTGVYNTTLTVTFFKADESLDPADLIIPISTRQGVNASAASVFAIPTVNASNTITFPRNANRAVFSISSCGQGDEEFWWSNALQTNTKTFKGGVIPGFSPFREVQLYIDGKLAGVQWPFPVIFTGGVNPTLWSPVVGIDAFDLQEYEIDISAWLGILCDGEEHIFSMKVAGLSDDGKNNATVTSPVGTSWSVTGKIFVWLDDDSSVTTGDPPIISGVDAFVAVSQSLTQNSTGMNDTLAYTTFVSRNLSISSTVTTQAGSMPYSWTQNMSHFDKASWYDSGNIQTNRITTLGADTSTGPIPYLKTYSYPLFANSSFLQTADGNTTLSAVITRSKLLSTSRSSIYPSGLQAFANLTLIPKIVRVALSTTQSGSATEFRSKSTNTSLAYGAGFHEIRLGGASGGGVLGMEPDSEIYFRRVDYANGTVGEDLERVAGDVMTDMNSTAVIIAAEIDALPDVGRRIGMQAFGAVPKEALLGEEV